jgi:glycosyltransferase involved in cell wall biosynthesis
MKLFMALGTGDIVDDLRRHTENVSERNETSITYSQQAYDYIKHVGIAGLFVSGNARPDKLVVGDFTAVHCPSTLLQRSGLSFHCYALAYGVRLAWMARKFGADLAVVDSGMTHKFILSAFWLFGIPIVVGMHNVRWANGFEPKRAIPRLIRWLDSFFYRRLAAAAIGCSPECEAQARADGADGLPFFQWRGQYQLHGFEEDRAVRSDGEFRILFAGRVERNKGVFDILDMARQLANERARPVVFEICGEGGALAELRAAVQNAALEPQVLVRGRLNRAELLAAYARANLVIVPTRGNFCEGMPLVCSEAVLAGVPVLTSRVSNALPLMGVAIAEAVPEDVGSYVDQIRRLIDDPAYYEARAKSCYSVSRQFVDRSKSYCATLDRLITHIFPERSPMSDYNVLFSEAAGSSASW